MNFANSSQGFPTGPAVPRSAMSGYPFNTYRKIRQENTELRHELESSRTENSDLVSQLSTQTQSCDDLKDQVQSLTEQLRAEQDQNIHSKGQIDTLTGIQHRTEDVVKNLHFKIEGMKELVYHKRFIRHLNIDGPWTELDKVVIFIHKLSDLIDNSLVGWDITDETLTNAKETFQHIIENIDDELNLELMNLVDTVSRIMLERRELVGRAELVERATS